jgi:hypothetical protein
MTTFIGRLRDDRAMPTCPDDEQAAHFVLPWNLSIVA